LASGTGAPRSRNAHKHASLTARQRQHCRRQRRGFTDVMACDKCGHEALIDGAASDATIASQA
jgi:hypothetical protein